MKIDLNILPTQSWVYIFKSKTDKYLYIWKAKNLKKRISQYFSTNNHRKLDMLSKANSLDFFITKNENEALVLETNLILKHRPIFNNLIRWERSYIYIKIKKEKFPQILLTRYKENDWAVYIWPKYFRNEIKKIIQILRMYFKFRTCKSVDFKKWVLCNDFVFWLCEWRCVYAKLCWKNEQYFLENAKKIWFKQKFDFNDSIDNYNSLIKPIKQFFEWDIKSLKKTIVDDINNAIKIQNFEWAWKLKTIFESIDKYCDKAWVCLNSIISWYFFYIKNIWNQYIIVLLNFFEWKIVDIVCNSHNISELTIEEIISNLNIEFWELQKITNFQVWDLQSIYLWNSKFAKISNKDFDLIIQNCKLYLDSYINSSNQYIQEWDNSIINQLLIILKERYNFKNFPLIVECLDISHLWWWWTSWWISQMNSWILNKKNYRHYKIKNKNIDDYQSLKEVIFRRFKLNLDEEIFCPDVFILDWWKWQLWIIKEIYFENEKFKNLFEKIQFISIWKWSARKAGWKLKWEKEKIYFFNNNFEIEYKEMIYDESDLLLIKLRDEAHRFSNRLRKIRMKNEIIWKK